MFCLQFCKYERKRPKIVLSLLHHWYELCEKYEVQKNNAVLGFGQAETIADDEDESLPYDIFEVEKLLNICYGDPTKNGQVGLCFKVSHTLLFDVLRASPTGAQN